MVYQNIEDTCLFSDPEPPYIGFTFYYHFTEYDFRAMLAPVNENLTGNLSYLSRYTASAIFICDTFVGELVY